MALIRWSVNLSGQPYSIEMEHDYLSGRRVIRVNDAVAVDTRTFIYLNLLDRFNRRPPAAGHSRLCPGAGADAALAAGGQRPARRAEPRQATGRLAAYKSRQGLPPRITWVIITDTGQRVTAITHSRGGLAVGDHVRAEIGPHSGIAVLTRK